jgi:hypothetical protein
MPKSFWQKWLDLLDSISECWGGCDPPREKWHTPPNEQAIPVDAFASPPFFKPDRAERIRLIARRAPFVFVYAGFLQFLVVPLLIRLAGLLDLPGGSAVDVACVDDGAPALGLLKPTSSLNT